jgi:sporulation protein YlmC with PRC-barrel domain
MAAPIDDPGKLRGETVTDQDGQRIGTVQELYGEGEGEDPSWVTVETPTGLVRKRVVFVPVARLKEEDGEIRVPYRKQHVQQAPEVETGGELSTADERRLRDHYGMDRADQEVRSDNESYAAKVPDEMGTARKLS